MTFIRSFVQRAMEWSTLSKNIVDAYSYILIFTTILIFIYCFYESRQDISLLYWLQRKYFSTRYTIRHTWRRLTSKKFKIPRIPYWFRLYIRSFGRNATVLCSLFSLIASIHFYFWSHWICFSYVLTEGAIKMAFFTSVLMFGKVPEANEFLIALLDAASISLLLCDIYPWWISKFRVLLLFIVAYYKVIIKVVCPAGQDLEFQEFPHMNGHFRHGPNQIPFDMWQLDPDLIDQMMEAVAGAIGNAEAAAGDMEEVQAAAGDMEEVQAAAGAMGED